MGRSLSRSSKVWFFTAHLGYLFGICVDKNSEVWHRTPQIQRESCISRKIKCMPRVSSMCFQDLGSSLATLQVAKAVDFFGCLTGSAIEIADAEQAYTQADMKGDPTWVCLPPEARPSWWRNKFPNLRRPVRRLKKKALCGHPDAGAYWEQKCDAHVQAVGFVPIGLEWPSCYYRAK